MTFVLVLLFKYGVRGARPLPAACRWPPWALRAGGPLALAAQPSHRPARRAPKRCLPPPSASLVLRLQCTKLIYGYMGFSGFTIFFVLTGVLALQLLQKAGAAFDWISFSYILFNFAVRRAAAGCVALHRAQPPCRGACLPACIPLAAA